MTPYAQIFENNRKWVASKTVSSPDYFRRLAQEQHPDYLYIGCSDSRVPANDIMGLEPGEVFVHRNVANLVHNADLNVMAAIEFAVSQLHVKHVIVCGHYNCGGVRAAMQSKDLGILNPWLGTIRDVYRLHKDELNLIEDEGSRYRRLVELNVHEQCISVCKMSAVQQGFVSHGYPRVHGWVFDLAKGLLIDLNIDFEAILSDMHQIYNLTGREWFAGHHANH